MVQSRNENWVKTTEDWAEFQETVLYTVAYLGVYMAPGATPKLRPVQVLPGARAPSATLKNQSPGIPLKRAPQITSELYRDESIINAQYKVYYGWIFFRASQDAVLVS